MGQVRGIVRVIPVVLVVLLPDCRPHNCAMASCPCRRLWKAPRASSHLGLGARGASHAGGGARPSRAGTLCLLARGISPSASLFVLMRGRPARLPERERRAPGRLCTDGVPSRCPGSHRLPIRCRPPPAAHHTAASARARSALHRSGRAEHTRSRPALAPERRPPRSRHPPPAGRMLAWLSARTHLIDLAQAVPFVPQQQLQAWFEEGVDARGDLGD